MSNQDEETQRELAEASRLSRRIFENPIRYSYILEGYNPLSLALTFALTLLITITPTLLSLLGDSVIDHSFAPGFNAGLELGSGIAIWTLALLQLPALLLCRWLLIERREEGFYRAYWAQSLIQFTWLQMLSFYMVPLFPLIGVALFVGLFFAWAFNDSLAFYNEPHSRRLYLVAFPFFDLLMLGVDQVGGRGLIYAWQSSPQYFFNILALQAALMVLTQAIISVIGRHIYDHDLRVVNQSQLLRELAVMRAERKVIQRTCGLMTQGLTATKFSHDVASPLMVLQHSIHELQRELGAPGESRHQKVLAPNWERLDRAQQNLLWSAEQINNMTQGMARSVRDADLPERQTIESLIREAGDAMATNLRGHGVSQPRLDIHLESASVMVTEGHATALANIFSNGIQQAPEASLEIRGRAVNTWFYLLSIRDFGISPEERPKALQAVLHSLSIERTDEREGRGRSERYQGFGLGLMMAKILFVRHNGWLGVSIPPEGRGLVMNVILPRCASVQIPEEFNQPERAAEEGGIDPLTLTDLPILDTHPVTV